MPENGRLPRVTQATRQSLHASYLHEEPYSGNALERMAEENPEVAGFITLYSQTHPECMESVAEGAILVYELLRRQAEADGPNVLSSDN